MFQDRRSTKVKDVVSKAVSRAKDIKRESTTGERVTGEKNNPLKPSGKLEAKASLLESVEDLKKSLLMKNTAHALASQTSGD